MNLPENDWWSKGIKIPLGVSGGEPRPALDSAHPASAAFRRSANSRRFRRLRQRGTSMSDFDRNYGAASRGYGAGRTAVIDAGLRAYMTRVYNYMAIGVA